MNRNRTIGPAPTRHETVNGFVYMAFQLILLPVFLQWVNGRLSIPLDDAQLNFVFFLLNFLAILVVCHNYLNSSLSQAFQHPICLCQAVILGVVAYYVSMYLVGWVISLLVPGFFNYNDEAIAALEGSNSFLILVGTVVLVPPVEESYFRGLIFRNLYSKSKWIAYTVSTLGFAALHILGYIGLYSPLEILMAVLQYLPAGIWLAWAYTKAGTILAPMLMHAIINYLSIQALR